MFEDQLEFFNIRFSINAAILLIFEPQTSKLLLANSFLEMIEIG
jgi:hypothetical protein